MKDQSSWHPLLKLAKCETKKMSLESYKLRVTMMSALGHFDFLQFGIPRWPPSAVTKYSTEHEIDNISITG